MTPIQKRFYDDTEFPEARVGISVRSIAQPDFIPHSHAFDELVIVRRGSGIHDVDGIRYQIESGDVFCVKRGREHSYSRTVGLEIVNVLFRDAYLARFVDRLRPLPAYHLLFEIEPVLLNSVGERKAIRLPPEDLLQAFGIAQKIEDELRTEATGFETAAELQLSLLLLFLCRREPQALSRGDRRLHRLAHLRQHIEQTFDQPLQLQDLADAVGLSIRTLNRYCNDFLGTSPMQLLTQYRIERAAALLKESELSVTEIAVLCGFSDSNYFARVFRDRVGLAPSRCRAPAR